MEEIELIKKLQEGDEDAYREFMAEYKGTVYRIIYSFSGMLPHIDDIAQEVFITVFRKIHKFRGTSSLSTWLYRVTFNKCKDTLRKNKRRTVELNDNIIHPGPDPLNAVLAAQTAGNMLAELPEKFRKLVILRELEGLTYDEIAATLKIPLGRVKIMLFRARKQMKEILQSGM